MTAIERSDDADAAAALHRRSLLVFMSDVDIADVAASVRDSASSEEFSDITVNAFQSTGGYRPDPNRPQQFIDVAAAVQIDYSPEHQPAVTGLMKSLELPTSLGDVTISVGAVVTCLELAGSHLLLLGAHRKADLTAEEFGRYWSREHAPHAIKELRAAPVPFGYELFLVDHELTAAGATARWQASEIDGWMHITSHGPSDFTTVARDPEHRTWVLNDEANFVNFAAPMIGQQMISVPTQRKSQPPSKKGNHANQ